MKTYVDASATPPGGSNTQVQYNDNGSFGGDAEMVYDDSSNVLNVYQLTADEVKLEGQLDVLLLHTGDKLLLE
ncbi:MAG: hypothetical protein GWN77_03250, partial [Gammaproteobacteria bacterium]|nr:hypothetical protein [Gammaproteobacteria bacterium]